MAKTLYNATVYEVAVPADNNFIIPANGIAVVGGVILIGDGVKKISQLITAFKSTYGIE